MFEMNLVHFMDCNNDLDVILKSVGKGDLFMREKRFLFVKSTVARIAPLFLTIQFITRL